jgi:transmembrane sensor
MNTPGPAMPWEDDDAISLRAADFFEQRRFGEWTDADQAELDAWIAESFLHRAAYLRVKGIVAYTEHLAAVHTFKVGPNSNEAASHGDGKFLGRWLVLPLLAAASIILSITLGIPFVSSLMQPPDRTYSTEVGGRTLLKFADGTEIDLDTDTVVRFRMTNQERTVWLEKGEGWFHVAHNAANPFNLIVGKHRVVDLGTEFLVRRGSDRMEVALLNGRASLNAEGGPIAMLTPGEDAIVTPVSVSVTRKTQQELADELAWRRGALVFRSTRLADAVREVNRYNQTKLVIADPSIADLKFTGEIRNDNFEGFLHIAQSMMKLRVDREGNQILISRGQRDETKRAAGVKRSL